jgi:hypothetical protein
MDAEQEHARLSEAKAAADRKVAAVEDEARQAGLAAQEASAALAQAERVGVSAAKRHALEAALAKAKGRAGEPWAERLAGAQAAARDAASALRQCVQANLLELIRPVEAEAEDAVAEMTTAAQTCLGAAHRREDAARRIGTLLAMSGASVTPHSVGPLTRAGEAIQTITRLLQEGEPVPRLQPLPVQAEAPAGDTVTA